MNKGARAFSRVRLVLLGLALAALIGAALFLPLKPLFGGVLDWARSLGYWGPAVLALLYVLATVFLVPGLVFSLGAGFLFGVGVGSVTVSVGSTLGAAAAFLIGRGLMREWIQERLGARPRFKALDEAVGRLGFRVVLLARLSPILPFNLLNYAFGLTRIDFWPYFFASWLGMLPATVMYVYFGSALRSLADVAAGRVETGPWGRAMFFLGLAATALAVTLVTRTATRIFRQTLEEAE